MLPDSTNPRVMADNIKTLNEKIKEADVNANPEGEATGTLTKLEVDGEIYAIPQGTSVVANPEDEATDTLTKLEVGEEVYEIPSYTPISYSATKQDTGMKWIDGSTVYAITLETNASISTNWTSLVDVSTLHIGKVIDAVTRSDDTQNFPIAIWYDGTSGYLKGNNLGSGSIMIISVTLYYTEAAS